MVIHGTFTTVWDDGVEINTPAVLDTKTGEITAESVDADNLGILIEEWFEDSEGEEYEVCPECHEFILHTCMEPDEYISHQLNELKRCKDPNCDYYKFVR